jgi:ABC-type uncharacterized transport system permease subunit
LTALLVSLWKLKPDEDVTLLDGVAGDYVSMANGLPIDKMKMEIHMRCVKLKGSHVFMILAISPVHLSFIVFINNPNLLNVVLQEACVCGKVNMYSYTSVRLVYVYTVVLQ